MKAATSEYIPAATEPQPLAGMPFIPGRLDDAALTLAQFRVLCHIARRGRCYESGPNMARACRVNRVTLWTALRFLIRWKMITKTGRPGMTSVFNITPITTWMEPGRKQGLAEKRAYPLKPSRRQPKAGPTHPYQKRDHEGNPSEVTPSKGGSPQSKNLFPREYNDLIADAQEEIRKLKAAPRTPDTEAAVANLKSKIRELKSQKLGVALPALPTAKSSAGAPVDQAPKLAAGAELKHWLDGMRAAVETRP
jgi:hypothetical protein